MERVGNNIVDRMIRAAKLDNNVYEELERDTGATGEAILVVAIVAIAAGIGGLLAAEVRGVPGASIIGFAVGVILSVLAYAEWSLITYVVGTRLFGGTADYGELLRTVGFAFTPYILVFFGFIPIFGGLIALIGTIWTLIAGVVAVRQALDFSTGRAILTVIVGGIIMIIITFILLVLQAGA